MMWLKGALLAALALHWSSIVSAAQSDCNNKVGYVRDSKNCGIFYYCEPDGRVHTFQCPANLWFDAVVGACNWPQGECVSEEPSGPGDIIDPIDSGEVDPVDSKEESKEVEDITTVPVLPNTNPPVTNPPVTDPPVTNPPVTDPPVTNPPVTDPPVTEPREPKEPDTTTTTTTTTQPPGGVKKVVCYFGSWAVYRPGDGKFDVEDIDPFVCTHIIFGFVGINSDGSVRVLDSWNEVDKAAFKRFACLKKLNPKLKALIAIGGWNEGSTKYSDVVASAAKRATFIKSAVSLIQQYDYDGFDLDWEYPNQRGGVPADVQNFVQLLKEFRAEFDKNGYLLTAAVAAAEFSASLSYDIPAISKYLDFINIMTYDMHGVWDGVTGHNAPLFASPDGLDVATSVEYWVRSGAPRSKLIVGIGTYGRTFTLTTSNTGIGAPISNGGTAGPYTRESGYLGYNEICVNIKQGGWTVVRHPEQRVPYAYKGNQWVGYDDPISIKEKADYVRSQELGGIMIWSFETDDFRNNCGEGRNPLLNAIRGGLGLERTYGNGWQSPCANHTIVWWDPGNNNNGGGGGGGSATPVDPAPDGICTKSGFVRDPVNCATFYYCQGNGASWSVSTFQCAAGTYYNVASGACDWASNVSCP